MKKFYKTLGMILAAICVLFGLFGCSLLQPKDKDFSVDGMTITLTDRFTEKSYVSMNAYYESPTAIVSVIKEDFAGTNYTMTEYAELVMQVNGLDSVITVSTQNTYASFSYEKEVSGKEFSYYATCHKSEEAYWLIQFGCTSDNYEKLLPDFEKWASSVVFE